MRLFSSLVVAAALAASSAVAQQPVPRAGRGPVNLSLDDALRMAQQQSQTVEIARSGVARAEGQRTVVRSQFMPQLNGTAGYTKTLKSQFSSFAGSAPARDTT